MARLHACEPPPCPPTPRRFVRIGVIGAVSVAQGFCLLGHRRLEGAPVGPTLSRSDAAAATTSAPVCDATGESPFFREVPFPLPCCWSVVMISSLVCVCACVYVAPLCYSGD